MGARATITRVSQRFVELVLQGELCSVVPTPRRLSRSYRDAALPTLTPAKSAALILTLADVGLPASSKSYGYLLRMPLLSLTAERVAQMTKQVEKRHREIDELSLTTEASLWQKELDELRVGLEGVLRQSHTAPDSAGAKPKGKAPASKSPKRRAQKVS